jgi:hypothetical protein
MNLATLLISLRQRLVDAWEQDDQESLSQLKTTFTTLREVSYEGDNKNLVSIFVALEDAARDAVMGVKGKSEIPSSDAIRLACSVKEYQRT